MEGLISGAQVCSPPSKATIAQSQGDPSSENILRGGPSSTRRESAMSDLSSNFRSCLRVRRIPEHDCSLAGASTTTGCPRA